METTGEYVKECLTCRMEFSTYDPEKIYCDKICAEWRVTYLGDVVPREKETA